MFACAAKATTITTITTTGQKRSLPYHILSTAKSQRKRTGPYKSEVEESIFFTTNGLCSVLPDFKQTAVLYLKKDV
jgi:hypothetical protein